MQCCPGVRAFFPLVIGQNVDLVPALTQDAQEQIDGDGGAAFLEERMWRQEENMHCVSFPRMRPAWCAGDDYALPVDPQGEPPPGSEQGAVLSARLPFSLLPYIAA